MRRENPQFDLLLKPLLNQTSDEEADKLLSELMPAQLMRLEFHTHVSRDISRIMDYYEDMAGSRLANEFYAELKLYFLKAAATPESYPVRERDLRRVNLKTFPYHFYFRLVDDRVRRLVVRHHKRRQSLNLHRR